MGKSKKLIFWSLFSAASLCFGAEIFSAWAATSLSEKGTWKITEFKGKNPERDSYCALIQPYSEDIYLSLGRNVLGEYSLAVDFQDGRLKTNEAYSVTLQPGPGQIRAYELMPVTPRALVVRLGYDSDFFDALAQSELLKFELNDESYHLPVPNLPEGNSKLEQCMLSLKKGSADTQVADIGFQAKKVDAPPKEKAVPPKPAAPAPAPVKAPVKEEVKPEPPKVAKPVPAPKKAEPVQVVEAKPVEVKPPPPKIEKKVEETVEEVKQAEVKTARIESKPPPPAPLLRVPEAVKVEEPVRRPTSTRDMIAEEISSPVRKLSVKPAQQEEKPAVVAQVDQKVEREPLKPRVQPPTVITPPRMVAPPEPQAVSKTDESVLRSRFSNGGPMLKSRVSRAIDPDDEEYVPSVNQNPKMKSYSPAVIPSSRDQDDLALIEQTEAQKKRRAEIEQLKSENQRLNQALQTEVNRSIISKPQSDSEMNALKEQVANLQKQLVDVQNREPQDSELQEQVEQLKEQNKNLSKALAEDKVQITKLDPAQEAELSSLKQTITDLQEQVNLSKAGDNAGGNNELAKQLENIKAENARLSAALQGQEDKISKFNEESPDAEDTLLKMRSRLKELEAENKRLVVDARKARGQIDTAVVEVGNNALQRIQEYEKKLSAAKEDNLMLSKEIDEMKRMQEDDALASVAGDWDLEKATRRYNEAEREIKRLGILLEQQKAANRKERAELESMLFDPVVTDGKQRRKLAELERKLAVAERKLIERGAGVPRDMPGPRSEAQQIAEVFPNSPKRDEIARATSPERVRPYDRVDQMTPRPPAPVQKIKEWDRFREAEKRNALVVEVDHFENTDYSRIRDANARAAEERIYAGVPYERSGITPPPNMDGMSSRFETNSPVYGQQPATMVDAPSSAPGLMAFVRRFGVQPATVISQDSRGIIWREGRITGKAHASSAPSMQQFSNQYIAQMERACNGDFASLPIGGGTQGFDVACMGGAGGSASSVIFTQNGADFIAIEYAGTVEDMNAVIDRRDSVISSM